MTEEENRKKQYYNVERFTQENRKTSAPTSRTRRALRRAVGRFGSSEGFWIPVLALPLVILVPFGILFLGLLYGPVAFWTAAVGGLGLGSYLAEKKFGKHVIVEEFPLLKRALLLVPVFLVILAVFLLVFFLGGRL